MDYMSKVAGAVVFYNNLKEEDQDRLLLFFKRSIERIVQEWQDNEKAQEEAFRKDFYECFPEYEEARPEAINKAHSHWTPERVGVPDPKKQEHVYTLVTEAVHKCVFTENQVVVNEPMNAHEQSWALDKLGELEGYYPIMVDVRSNPGDRLKITITYDPWTESVNTILDESVEDEVARWSEEDIEAEAEDADAEWQQAFEKFGLHRNSWEHGGDQIHRVSDDYCLIYRSFKGSGAGYMIIDKYKNTCFASADYDTALAAFYKLISDTPQGDDNKPQE